MEIANFVSSSHAGRRTLREIAKTFVVIFLFTYILQFLAMPLRPNLYDEAITLTGSMQVGAGLLPHRDFHTLYGPAGFYVLTILFKVFGQSVLIERLLDLLFRALIVASVYTIASSYLRRSIALWTTAGTFFWLYGLFTPIVGTAVLPASFFNLISTALLIPFFSATITKRRMMAAGALAAIAVLFRYDVGIFLLTVHTCIVATAIWLRFKTNRASAFFSAFWPYLAAFIIVILPPALYYRSVSSFDPLLFDVVKYPGLYYHRARNLPFPGIGIKSFDNVSIYLPIPVIALSFYCFAIIFRRPANDKETLSNRETRQLGGFFFSFALLALAMCSKDLVRTSVTNCYLAAIPCLLLVATLFQQRWAFQRYLRISIVVLASLSIMAPAWTALRQLKNLHKEHASIPESVWASVRGRTPALRTAWCSTPNAATRGLCFLPTDDEIQAIEFIDAHTRPDQKLFVGVPRHDKIFANDMLIYFASQRLPATPWAEFDTDLQSQAEIQKQMIRDLELSSPPFIVLDSEFENVNEPNDSARSSGVTLLDDYIGKNHKQVQKFGTLSIWQSTLAP
jgi:hypothetical protein